jgi:para-nitrobenzyl esterase
MIKLEKVILCFLVISSIMHNESQVSAQTNNNFPVQVKIENGIIEGLYDTKSSLQLYLGIPFAKPPVGNLRWKAPQPLDHWDGVKSTKAFGPRAVQSIVFGDMNSRSNGISEDCLYLNVWTPAKKNTTGLPVLVYFFGGGFVAGDGSEPRYDGAAMAKKGIVVVTVNYRLGLFGFFAHPDLSKEAPYKASGNYGLLDQAFSLQWVQKNIAAFGGDPKKVTIAGESAGSISVSAQMVSPLSKNLIAGAIGESGSGMRALGAVTLAEGEKVGAEFAKNAGYNSLAQLRVASTRDLYDAYVESKRFGFPSVIDGYFYPKSMVEIFTAKEQAQIPLLLGWNSAEIPGMAFMQGLPYSEENLIKKVKEAYPNDYEEALKVYPHGNAKEVEWAATNLAADRFIAYSTWKWFEMHRKNSGQPVYRYLYSKLRPPLVDKSLTSGLAGGTQRSNDAPKMPELIGAPHACEIEYCMGNLNLIKDYAWTNDDYKVSDTMLNYFANFIKNGNPNGDKLPEWPAAKAEDVTPPVMVLDTESKAVKTDDARYYFLDKVNKSN